MFRYLALLFSVLFFSQLYSQNKISPNLINRLQLGQKARSGQSNDLYKAYLLTHGDASSQFIDSLNTLGVKVNVSKGDLLTVEMPFSVVDSVVKLDKIKYIQLAESVTFQTDSARFASHVDEIHQGMLCNSPYTGKGVVIGVIDMGFDYAHPNFRTSDGTTCRIKRVWEQDCADGTPPNSFNYGTELTEESEILAAGGDVITNSHGTHVTGIAAGAWKGNPWYGVAYDADLVLVSMSSDENLNVNNVCVSDAISYIFSYADSVGKPCVINMSLGTTIGPHDGTSPFDLLAGRLQGKGRLLVGSSGNFGSSKTHVSKCFLDSTDQPLKTFVNWAEKPTANSRVAKLDLWGDGEVDFEVTLAIVNIKTGEIVQQSEPISSNGENAVFQLSKNSKGQVAVASEINPFNGKNHVSCALNVSSIRINHALAVIVSPLSSGTVHMWADNTHVSFTNNNLEGWFDGDDDFSIGEIGGTGKEVLSVGAYTTRCQYLELDATTPKMTDEHIGCLSSFSPNGPTIDGRMKPDVSAPGSFIISSLSSHDVNISRYPLVSYALWEDKSFPYGYMQGTSMAAPFVTGVVALWLQAFPSLSISDLHDILSKTSIEDEYTGNLNIGNSQWGYGKINAMEGLRLILNSTGLDPVKKEDFVTISFLDNNLNFLFSGILDKATMTISDVSGRVLTSKCFSNLSFGDKCAFSLDDLPKGIFIVNVIYGKNTNTFKFVKN